MNYKNDVDERYMMDKYDVFPCFEQATLRIEITNACNHRCIFCPNSFHGRKRKNMDPILVERIIVEAAELKIKRVALFMNGEPFLVPDLAKYVKLCKIQGIEYVFITTNAGVATEDRMIEVLEAGLDSIKFSINAGTRESYKKIHGADGYDKAMSLLRFTRKHRDENHLACRILVGFVVTDFTQEEMELQASEIINVADDILFFKPDNFGGYMTELYKNYFSKNVDTELPFYDYPNKNLPCTMLFNSINVTCEGYLTLCCSEALNYMVIEDINKLSLKDAWHSKAMAEIRTRHINGNVSNTQCYRCIFDTQTSVEPLNYEFFLKGKE